MKAQNENLVAANFKELSKDCHTDVSNGLSRHHSSRSNPSPRFLGLIAETKSPTGKRKYQMSFLTLCQTTFASVRGYFWWPCLFRRFRPTAGFCGLYGTLAHKVKYAIQTGKQKARITPGLCINIFLSAPDQASPNTHSPLYPAGGSPTYVAYSSMSAIAFSYSSCVIMPARTFSCMFSMVLLITTSSVGGVFSL